jgi:hypothetical protein
MLRGVLSIHPGLAVASVQGHGCSSDALGKLAERRGQVVWGVWLLGEMGGEGGSVETVEVSSAQFGGGALRGDEPSVFGVWIGLGDYWIWVFRNKRIHAGKDVTTRAAPRSPSRVGSFALKLKTHHPVTIQKKRLPEATA